MRVITGHQAAEPTALGARMAFRVLCIAYLILGVTHATWFASNELPPLTARALQTSEAVAALEGQQQDPPAGVLEGAANDRRLAARAAWRAWGRGAGFVVALGVVSFFLISQSRRLKTRAQVISAATLMIVLAGGILLASRLLVLRVIPGSSGWGLADLFVLHIAACAILSWTPRESIMPFVLLLLVWGATFLVPQPGGWDVIDRLVAVIVGPLILLPGTLLSAWRGRRRQEDEERIKLSEQMRSIGGELSRARVVHDAIFPAPFDSGFLRFEFDYRPSAQIGGDFVHLHACTQSGRICLTLLDVAGHGLAAALTVNRLFGGLERIRAEDPEASPGSVMALLNRYIHLTMARHGMYATGTCIMLDPTTGALTWVNAGHPPGLVRKTGGRLIDLPGTTLILAARSPGEFETGEQSVMIEPGDVVIAFTDGAFEARDAAGRRYGIEAIRGVARFDPPPRDWSKFIGNAVAAHHGGRMEDDVLIATIHLRGLRLAELHHEDEPSQQARAQQEPAGSRE